MRERPSQGEVPASKLTRDLAQFIGGTGSDLSALSCACRWGALAGRRKGLKQPHGLVHRAMAASASTPASCRVHQAQAGHQHRQRHVRAPEPEQEPSAALPYTA